MTSHKKKGPVLLITAFEPFDGAKTNSSLIMLEKLAEKDWDGRVAFFGPVPVSFAEAWPIIEQEMKRYPDLKGIICMGQAEGTVQISLERMALNWMQAGIPDNDGAKPKGPVIKGAPSILKATFPWHELEESPLWECSYNAGRYVCNSTMFNAVSWARGEEKHAGFIHLPLLASQKGDPGLGEESPRLDDAKVEKGLSRIIDFALDTLEPELALKAKPALHHKQDGPRP
jgi:pyroglutamyl-peptidase